MKTSLIIIAVATLISCPAFTEDSSDDGWNDNFSFDHYTMVSTGKNPYWRLNPGRYVVLGTLEPHGGEFVVISVLDETETIDDIETRVIEEREYKDGKLTEISRNFFAMAKETKDVFLFLLKPVYATERHHRHGAGILTVRPLEFGANCKPIA